jgi:hypothetical protein
MSHTWPIPDVNISHFFLVRLLRIGHPLIRPVLAIETPHYALAGTKPFTRY